MWARFTTASSKKKERVTSAFLAATASTPTPSEFGEYDDRWYGFADWLWLAAQDSSVGKKDYIRYATAIDEVPRVSEYFRWLCQYDLYFVPVSYLVA